jgi:hypothetical protein
MAPKAAKSFLDEAIAKDASWGEALALCRKQLNIPPQLTRLMRSGWASELNPQEFLRLLGFSRFNPSCLIEAAKPNISTTSGAGGVLEAVQFLGIQFSAAVVGINYVVRRLLITKPPPLWKSLLVEVMTNVEIGQKLGAKVPALSESVGALLGFARMAGQLIMMAENAPLYKQVHFMPNKKERKKSLLQYFGCEPSQIAPLVLQQLGFGTDIAVGAALALCDLKPHGIIFNPQENLCKAGVLWIEALRVGRNFPADPEVRGFFSELIPPTNPSSVTLPLEVLYTEIAGIRKDGSTLTWHLPRPTYEATAEHFGIK